MADERTEGTFGEDAELVGAAVVDANVDAPIWLWNKLTGGDVPAPVHLASDVYADQTAGQWGDDVSVDDVQAATSSAEDQGAIVDAAKKTGQDIEQNPFSVIPTWAWVAGGIVAVIASIAGSVYLYAAIAPALRVVKS